jgi:hypothetical protein
MTVKHIHFIKHCPNLPIYEMEDGTLRLPYFQKKIMTYFWFSLAELEAGEGDVKKLMAIRQPFTEAKAEIESMREQKKKSVN